MAHLTGLPQEDTRVWATDEIAQWRGVAALAFLIELAQDQTLPVSQKLMLNDYMASTIPRVWQGDGGQTQLLTSVVEAPSESINGQYIANAVGAVLKNEQVSLITGLDLMRKFLENSKVDYEGRRALVFQLRDVPRAKALPREVLSVLTGVIRMQKPAELPIAAAETIRQLAPWPEECRVPIKNLVAEVTDEPSKAHLLAALSSQ